MVVEGFLPEGEARPFGHSPLKLLHDTGNRRGDLWSPATTCLYFQNEMEVVRHDNKFIQPDIGINTAQAKQFFFYNPAEGREGRATTGRPYGRKP